MRPLTLSVRDPSLRALAGDLRDGIARLRPDVQISVGEEHGDLTLERAGSDADPADGEVLAVLRRGDPRDGLLVTDEHAQERARTLAEDPLSVHPSDPLRAWGPGAHVVASGALRCAQIRATRPDLELSVWEESEAELLASWPRDGWDGAMLPCDTLDRAERGELARRRLDAPWIGAPGAGTVWIRGPWDAAIRELLLPLDDRGARLEVTAEHTVAHGLTLPDGFALGVQATVSQSRLDLRALVIDPLSLAAMAASRQGEATTRGCARLAAMLTRDLLERGASTAEPTP